MVRTYRKRRLRGVRRRYGRRRLQSSSTVGYAASYAGLGPPNPYRGGTTIRYQAGGRSRANMMAQRARAQALNRVRRKNTRSSIPKGYQMTRQKYAFGRNYSNGTLLRKLDNKTLDQRILFNWGINRCTATLGYYELGVQLNASAAMYMPLHLHELTINSTSNSSGNRAWTSMRMVNTSTGNVEWYPLTRGNASASDAKPGGATGDGGLLATSANQEMINQNSGLGTTNGINQMLEWVNAKFCFRLPTQRAGWIKVSMIQFTDNDYLPSAQNNIFLPGSDGSMFWQKVVKPSLFSPIQGNGITVDRNAKAYRVIKTWTKTFQPAETTEGDGNGNHYQMKIFARLNKYLRYANQQPRPQDGNLVDAVELTGGELLNSATNATTLTQNYPSEWRSRVYLLVQGSHFDDATNVGVAVSPTNTITYDYHLRSKYLQRQQVP